MDWVALFSLTSLHTGITFCSLMQAQREASGKNTRTQTDIPECSCPIEKLPAGCPCCCSCCCRNSPGSLPHLLLLPSNPLGSLGATAAAAEQSHRGSPPPTLGAPAAAPAAAATLQGPYRTCYCCQAIPWDPLGPLLLLQSNPTGGPPHPGCPCCCSCCCRAIPPGTAKTALKRHKVYESTSSLEVKGLIFV